LRHPVHYWVIMWSHSGHKSVNNDVRSCDRAQSTISKGFNGNRRYYNYCTSFVVVLFFGSKLLTYLLTKIWRSRRVWREFRLVFHWHVQTRLNFDLSPSLLEWQTSRILAAIMSACVTGLTCCLADSVQRHWSRLTLIDCSLSRENWRETMRFHQQVRWMSSREISASHRNHVWIVEHLKMLIFVVLKITHSAEQFL